MPACEAAICGAGIAGVSAAYYLAVRHGMRGVTLIEAGAPLSLTSDKSTECYRNWWPGPGTAMVALMNRSIDLLEGLAVESGNAFHLNRRGYLYLSADPQRVPAMQAAAEATSRLGAGPLRIHRGLSSDPDYVPGTPEGYAGQPAGADLLLDPALIQRHFPYLNPQVIAALHVRRAGWFSAQQLGAYLLEKARQAGVRLLRDRVVSVDARGGRVRSLRLESGEVLETPVFINAAGPLVQPVAQMLGIDLPVYHELHQKVAFRDPLGAVPRAAPLLIWSDPQQLPWSPAEHLELAEDVETRWLVEEFPPGAHTRPEGGAGSNVALMLWEYKTARLEPAWPLPLDPLYPEVALRGLSTMLPALRAYFGKAPRPVVDGGYYTRTQENRPLVCPLPVEGAYLIGALSGFGLMAGAAAGELLAAHVCGDGLPEYAPAFSLERYEDQQYMAAFVGLDGSGQL